MIDLDNIKDFLLDKGNWKFIAGALGGSLTFIVKALWGKLIDSKIIIAFSFEQGKLMIYNASKSPIGVDSSVISIAEFGFSDEFANSFQMFAHSGFIIDPKNRILLFESSSSLIKSVQKINANSEAAFHRQYPNYQYQVTARATAHISAVRVGSRQRKSISYEFHIAGSYATGLSFGPDPYHYEKTRTLAESILPFFRTSLNWLIHPVSSYRKRRNYRNLSVILQTDGLFKGLYEKKLSLAEFQKRIVRLRKQYNQNPKAPRFIEQEEILDSIKKNPPE
ncbi:hypothetical protein [Leptospira santarosai]|uniref:hypothetical protein n=1 Tax=Leptospira santarosai TaxID=28183 RepID=UPI0002D6097B|nr:hypothetical protein [Leptospira santarosai]